VLAVKGFVAPGVPAASAKTPATFSAFSPPVVGSGGRQAFFAKTSGGARGLGRGLWYSPDGVVLSLLALEGAGAPDGGVFRSFTSLALPDAETSGPVFTATLSTNAALGITAASNAGLWALGPESGLTLLLRAGQTLAVDGVVRQVRSFQALTAAPASAGSTNGFDANGGIFVLAKFADGLTALLRFPPPP
jgi:hypothetical protein